MSRILIVEDDVVLARALKNWLERERLQVTCAITAANARRIIANEEVDMILSDLRLPDGDGIELLEWMKKNKCRIPLIIMTQHAEVSSAIRAMKAGAEDYLPKPIHPETLYPKLNDVLLRTRKTKRKQTDILQRVSPPIREVERRARLVAISRSCPSIAEPSRKSCPQRNFSVTSTVRSRELSPTRREYFMRRMAGRCFSTRWAICLTRCRRTCSVYCRNAATGLSAAGGNMPATCVSWPPRTRTSSGLLPKDISGRICTTA